MKKNVLIAALCIAAALTQAGVAQAQVAGSNKGAHRQHKHQAGVAQAQVAGSTTLGVAVTEMGEVVNGWSAKKGILGKAVYNDADQKIGTRPGPDHFV